MTRRYFIPGSEWLYAKLYTGPKTAERLLTGYIHPLLEEWMTKGQINRYFFLRYGDPEFHLRLRLHIKDDAACLAAVLERLHNLFSECMEAGLLSNVTYDTYQREIERYGIATIELSESLFCIDSRHILRLLAALARDDEADPDTLRWQLSLRLVDDWLAAFNYDIEGKVKLMSLLSESFRREFGMTQRIFTKQINDKYRKLKGQINASFDLADPSMSRYASLLRERHSEIAGALPSLLEALGTQESPDRDALIRSYIHMTMNRMFRSRNRTFELVIYDFLLRYYKSRLAYPAAHTFHR